MKIQDYNPFLGILELLGILFPGAILTLYLFYSVGDKNLGFINLGKETNSFIIGFVFLIISYFLGQVIFQFGSYIDDIYDVIKDRVFDQKELKKVIALRGITEDSPKPALSTFEWSLMTLQNKENQKPYNEVVKMKADSKFFRAVFIIGFFGIIYFLIFLPFELSILCSLVFVMLVSFIFYLKIRQKCAKTMYKHMLFYFEKGEI